MHKEFIYMIKRKKKIIKTKKKIDESFMLHGPYTKRVNDQVIEDGVFYFECIKNNFLIVNKITKSISINS